MSVEEMRAALRALKGKVVEVGGPSLPGSTAVRVFTTDEYAAEQRARAERDAEREAKQRKLREAIAKEIPHAEATLASLTPQSQSPRAVASRLILDIAQRAGIGIG